jgi:hypothetical protein
VTREIIDEEDIFLIHLFMNLRMKKLGPKKKEVEKSNNVKQLTGNVF